MPTTITFPVSIGDTVRVSGLEYSVVGLCQSDKGQTVMLRRDGMDIVRGVEWIEVEET